MRAALTFMGFLAGGVLFAAAVYTILFIITVLGDLSWTDAAAMAVR